MLKKFKHLTHLEGFEEKLQSFKRTLSKYNSLLKFEGVPQGDLHNPGEFIANLNYQLNSISKQENPSLMVPFLLELRVQAIESNQGSRNTLIEELISADFLC